MTQRESSTPPVAAATCPACSSRSSLVIRLAAYGEAIARHIRAALDFANPNIPNGAPADRLAAIDKHLTAASSLFDGIDGVLQPWTPSPLPFPETRFSVTAAGRAELAKGLEPIGAVISRTQFGAPICEHGRQQTVCGECFPMDPAPAAFVCPFCLEGHNGLHECKQFSARRLLAPILEGGAELEAAAGDELRPYGAASSTRTFAEAVTEGTIVNYFSAAIAGGPCTNCNQPAEWHPVEIRGAGEGRRLVCLPAHSRA